MSDPVLHLLAGPNGSGKSTLYEHVIGPATGLPFVNADVIALDRWPHDTAGHAYAAAALAAEWRADLIGRRSSFVTETVFSHRSKLVLLADALSAGYLVTLHVVMVPEELAVRRVAHRVAGGGHPVPDDKVRLRHRRLWPLVAEAVAMASEAVVYDNGRARRPFLPVARFERGRLLSSPAWPTWAPPALVALG